VRQYIRQRGIQQRAQVKFKEAVRQYIRQRGIQQRAQVKFKEEARQCTFVNVAFNKRARTVAVFIQDVVGDSADRINVFDGPRF